MSRERDVTVPLTFVLAGGSNMVSGGLTNWVDVVKVRMQCDSQNKAVYQRTYPGLVRGAAKVFEIFTLVTNSTIYTIVL